MIGFILPSYVSATTGETYTDVPVAVTQIVINVPSQQADIGLNIYKDAAHQSAGKLLDTATVTVPTSDFPTSIGTVIAELIAAGVSVATNNQSTFSVAGATAVAS